MRTGWLAAAVLAAACSSAGGPQEVGREFRLQVGATASFPELGFQVRFIGVTTDSRCAIDVVCVWAGDAGVVLETAPLLGDAREDTLHTTLGPTSVLLGSVELRLARLEPDRQEGKEIQPDEYVVVLDTRR